MAGKPRNQRPGRVPAAYAPAKTLLAYHADLASEASPDEFMAALVDELRHPSPFHPRRAARDRAEALRLAGVPELADGRWHLFCLDAGYVGAAEAPPHGTMRSPSDPFRLFSVGTAFVAEADAKGIRAGRRRLPAVRLAGLVRLSADGGVLCPADAPLAVQAAALRQCPDPAHAAHLASLAAHLAGTGDPASEDEAASYAGRDRDGPTGWHAHAALLAAGVARSDRATALGAVERFGRMLGIGTATWSGRAAPGGGHHWERIDDLLEPALGEPVPLRALRATWASGDVAGRDRASQARGWIARHAASRSAADGPFLAEAGRDARLCAAVVLDGAWVHVVAWDAEASEPAYAEAVDPLATEEVAGLDPTALLSAREPPESLGGSRLPSAAVPVPGMPCYGPRALLMAHASGATLGDLADAVSQAAPPATGAGALDALFGGSPSPRAARAPEPAPPWIERFLGTVDPEGLDLDGEAMLLREAEVRGATLLDLARRLLGTDRGGGVEPAPHASMVAHRNHGMPCSPASGETSA